jgi:hypothetical protein
MVLAALILLAGPALPVVITAFAVPAQAEVMPSAAGSLGGGLVSVVTVQTDLPALTLFAPLLLLGAIAIGITGGFAALAKSSQARPPMFSIPGAIALNRLRDSIRAARVPDQYRSILDPRALEKAAAGGRPFLWLAALVALAVAVNR